MKKFKRVCAFFMLLCVVFSNSVVIMAADKTYDVYQIFTGDYADETTYPGNTEITGKVLSNIKWGQNGTGTVGGVVDDAVLSAISNVASSTSTQEKLSAVTPYVDLESTPLYSGKTVAELNALSLANGYYLVKGSAGDNESMPVYTLSVIDNKLNFSPKSSDTPTIEKVIVDGTETHRQDESFLGDVVDFRVTSVLPDNMTDYNEYYWVLQDTLPSCFEYKSDSLSLFIGDEEATGYYVGVTDQVLTVGFNNIKAVKGTSGAVLAVDNAVVTVEYSVNVLDTAVMASSGSNDNSVILTYSNNPNISGDGTKTNDPDNPPETDNPSTSTVVGENTVTKTWITGVTVEHHTRRDHIPLEGSKFTFEGPNTQTFIKYTHNFIEDASGNYYKLKDGTYTSLAPDDNTKDLYDGTPGAYTMYRREDTLESKDLGDVKCEVTIDANGQLSIAGLGAGTYTLTNIEIPNGYKLADPITFTISFDETNIFSDDSDEVTEQDEWFYIYLFVDRGLEFPEAGGIGIIVIVIAGALAFVGGGTMIILNRKKKQ